MAEQVLNPWTHFHVRVYFYGSKATWTWYTNCRTRVKSALEGVRYHIMHSRGAYVDEVKDMIRDCLSTPSHLLDMGITSNIAAGVDIDNQRRRSTVISEFLWTLSGNRLFGKCHLAFRRPIMEASCAAALTFVRSWIAHWHSFLRSWIAFHFMFTKRVAASLAMISCAVMDRPLAYHALFRKFCHYASHPAGLAKVPWVWLPSSITLGCSAVHLGRYADI